jgi:hypothetical protein
MVTLITLRMTLESQYREMSLSEARPTLEKKWTAFTERHGSVLQSSEVN